MSKKNMMLFLIAVGLAVGAVFQIHAILSSQSNNTFLLASSNPDD